MICIQFFKKDTLFNMNQQQRVLNDLIDLFKINHHPNGSYMLLSKSATITKDYLEKVDLKKN